MSPLELPYPGFSWSLNQHIGPAANQHAMYEFLRGAHLYGNFPEPGRRITEHVVALGLVPPNVRQDVKEPQVWRDYQQVLADLGLIVSTRFTKKRVQLTDAGLMWLDGMVGYAELLTTQVLSFQYPNGQKQDISSQLRKKLLAAGMSAPATRIRLDADSGVKIKPAVLILRVLLELIEGGDSQARISRAECLSALVPTRRNADWLQALDELARIRQGANTSTDTTRMRHIQEWFRLLGLTDIFSVSQVGISLTPAALERKGVLRQLCEFHEQDGEFWKPENTSKALMAFSWFNHFGNPGLLSQWVAPASVKTPDYVDQNYPQGAEEAEILTEDRTILDWALEMNLRSFEPSQPSPSPSLPGQFNLEMIVQGQVRRHQSGLLHERIVHLVAERLRQKSFEVRDDRQSVDLLALKTGAEAIIEVKTVTPQSVRQRMRLGIGQLSEYRYRREVSTHTRPSGVLVLSSTGSFPDWLKSYFEKDVRLGLVSLASSENFIAHTSGDIEKDLAS
jgi:hypothetical protein